MIDEEEENKKASKLILDLGIIGALKECNFFIKEFSETEHAHVKQYWKRIKEKIIKNKNGK